MISTEEDVLIIKSIDFIGKDMLLVNLSNDRALFVPLSRFEELASLTTEQRLDFEIIDGQYLSFLSISDVYSIHDLAGF